MSVPIHFLFTPDELTLELEWFEAHDTLLGVNFVKQDVKRALELAAASKHPQCQWLTDLFAKKTVKTCEGARDVFLADSLANAKLFDEWPVRYGNKLALPISSSINTLYTEKKNRLLLFVLPRS
jgi:hypothetical protein